MNNLDTLSETQSKTCNKKIGNTKPTMDTDTINFYISSFLYGYVLVINLFSYGSLGLTIILWLRRLAPF
jgi:hypothetical protein